MHKPCAIIETAIKSKREHNSRSKVFDWLWQRYDVYGVQLGNGGIDWDRIAHQLGVEGITDGRGQIPTGKTVQATFYKVRKKKQQPKVRRRPVKPEKKQIRRTFRRSAA